MADGAYVNDAYMGSLKRAGGIQEAAAWEIVRLRTKLAEAEKERDEYVSIYGPVRDRCSVAEAQNKKMREALKEIARDLNVPLPDPSAHSEHAYVLRAGPVISRTWIKARQALENIGNG